MTRLFWPALLAALALLPLRLGAQQTSNPSSGDVSKNELSVDLPMGDQRSPAVKFKVTVMPAVAKPGDVVDLRISASTQAGWHVNPIKIPAGAIGFPTTIVIKSAGLEAVDKTFTPSQAAQKRQASGLTQYFHKGKFSWKRKYRVRDAGLVRIDGTIQFQACNAQRCLPPTKLAFTIDPSDKLELSQSGSSQSGSSQSPPSPQPTSASAKSRTPVVTAVPTHETIGQPIQIKLEPCDLSRPKAKLSLLSLLLGSNTEKLVLKGSFSLDGRTRTIYLPRSRRYRLTNTGRGETNTANTATYVSVDHDGDGKLVAAEATAANRPFRVADSMFRVILVDKQNQQLTLQQVDAPLSGTVVGRKVPPFTLTTVDGAEITDQDILGKVTLLDVWAVT